MKVPTNVQNKRVCFKEKKDQVTEENHFHQINKQSIKVMVLSCLICKSVYFKEKKDQVPDENLFHQTNKQSTRLV